MRRRDSEHPPLVYRSASHLVLGGLALLLELWFLVTSVGNLDHHGERVSVAALLLAGVLVFATTMRPAVIADEERILIRNPFRSISVPWSQVSQFTVRYSLDVEADGRSYSCWALPRPGRRDAARSGRQTQRAEPKGFAAPPPGSSLTEQAVEELTLRMNQLRATAAASTGSGGGDGDVRISWSRPMLAALAVAVMALVLALVIGS
jgi:hypothetical protein